MNIRDKMDSKKAQKISYELFRVLINIRDKNDTENLDKFDSIMRAYGGRDALLKVNNPGMNTNILRYYLVGGYFGSVMEMIEMYRSKTLEYSKQDILDIVAKMSLDNQFIWDMVQDFIIDRGLKLTQKDVDFIVDNPSINSLFMIFRGCFQGTSHIADVPYDSEEAAKELGKYTPPNSTIDKLIWGIKNVLFEKNPQRRRVIETAIDDLKTLIAESNADTVIDGGNVIYQVTAGNYVDAICPKSLALVVDEVKKQGRNPLIIIYERNLNRDSLYAEIKRMGCPYFATPKGYDDDYLSLLAFLLIARRNFIRKNNAGIVSNDTYRDHIFTFQHISEFGPWIWDNTLKYKIDTQKWKVTMDKYQTFSKTIQIGKIDGETFAYVPAVGGFKKIKI